MPSRMSQPSAPNSLRRFFDRVVHEGYASALTYMRKVYLRPEHGTPDLPFFRRLVTEW